MILQTRTWKPRSFDETGLVCEAILATERPSAVFDWQSAKVIEESLHMGGCSWPESGQIPLLDSHSRESIHKILGHASSLHVEGDKLVAQIAFAADEDGRAAAGKVKGGHLSDLSIGYRVHESVWIPAGETEVIDGKSFTGPVKVATNWEVLEASLTAIGADVGAKVRSKAMENENTTTEEKRIDPIVEERRRISEINRLATSVGVTPGLAQRLIDSGASLDTARASILEVVARTQSDPIGPGRIVVTEDAERKKENAIVDGLLLRSNINLDKPAPGADEFRHMRLVDLAKDSLTGNGQRVSGLSHTEIFKRSMTTSDFPMLLSSYAGKALRVSFENAPSTFQLWTNKGSHNNFKEFRRLALSEGPDLSPVMESEEYTYGSLGEGQEIFRLQKHGKILRLSYEMLVNDDLDAFARLIKVFTSGAKRQLNKLVYTTLADGTHEMADGLPIFHEDHHNLSANGVKPNIYALSEAKAAIKLQKGLLTNDALNIEPAFLIAPVALTADCEVLLNTQFGYEADDHKANPHYRTLGLVIDPALDAVDADSWFVAADPKSFDTIEICYLDGQETPWVEEQWNFNNDSWDVKCRFIYAVCAVDYRGLFKNLGKNGD